MPITKRWLSSLFLTTLCTAALLPAAAHADPAIDGINPARAPMQSFMTIYGSGFGDFQGTGIVTIGGRPVPVTAWSGNAIHVVVNPLAYIKQPMEMDTDYPVQVITGAGVNKSNTVSFTLMAEAAPSLTDPVGEPCATDQPVFECFQKSLFCPGDTAIFYGSGFGATQGSGFVTIDVPVLEGGVVVHKEFALPVLSWSENAISISLNLPSNVVPGIWTITVHRGNGKTASGSLNGGIRNNGNCIGGTPQLSLSRDYISFADLCVGKTAGPLCFTITNTGSAPLIINSIGIQNCSSSVDPVYISCASVAGFQIVSGGGSGSLAAGQSRDVCITFTPGEAATFDGRVIISSNASSTPAVVQLHGTGDNCVGPQATLSSTSMSFGDLKIGNTAGPLCFTVTNTGNAPLTINGISFINCSNSVEPHYVDCAGVAGLSISSGGSPGTLAPGASRTVCVTFSPHEAATFDMTVMISTNAPGGPVFVNLHGTGDK